MCTPCASGCWPSGVANVESTTVNGPRSAPSSSRSTSSRRGLDGVSASTSIVRPGRTAAANAPGSVPSTSVSSMPKRWHGPWRKARVPAYSWRWATMWSPAEHSASTTVLERAHARGERQRRLGAFQLGDRLLERAHGRVGVAPVELVRPRRGGPAVGVGQVAALPHARRPQRRRQRRPAVRPSGGDHRGGRALGDRCAAGVGVGGGLVGHPREATRRRGRPPIEMRSGPLQPTPTFFPARPSGGRLLGSAHA